MTNTDQLSQPLTLPDTQDAEMCCFTQSQDLPSSQQNPVVWGRLCPIKLPFKTTELTKDVYTLGRSESCDITIATDVLMPKWLSAISKVHFKITREIINNETKDTVVYLEDLSQNGTLVNKEIVGKGNRVILENNDVIYLVQRKIKAYVYMSTTSFEIGNLPEQLKNKYAISRKLGSGACGEVNLIFSKVGCKKFAMKTIMKIGGTGTGQKHPLNDPAKIMNEVEILKALKHPNIIEMKEIVDTPRAVYIVLELMEGGELFDRIKNKGKLSEAHAKLIFYQVVLAVHYLHVRGITHRDLKPENILLADKSDITIAKVSDFGLSKLVDAQTMMKTFCGTPMYVAPEILSTIGRGSYTNQVDVWSLGVILYVCLSGIVPFNCHNERVSLQEQIKKGYYSFPQSKFAHVSDEAMDLIKRMMTVNPKRRITITQIMLHPWLQDHELHETIGNLIYYENQENNIPSNNYHNSCYTHGPVKRARMEV